MDTDEEATAWSFTKEFREHWFAAMSGGASVPFTVAAVYVDNKWAAGLLAVAALTCAWFAAYRIWKPEREALVTLRKKLRPIIDVFVDSESAGVRLVDTEVVDPSNPFMPPKDGLPSRWVQLIVRSKTGAPLEQCEARALSFEAKNGPNAFKLTEPVYCTWSNVRTEQSTVMTIPAGVSQPVNLMWFDDNESRLHMGTFTVKAGVEKKIQNPNVFRFEIAISASDAQTVRVVAEIVWDGNPENIRLTLEH